MVAVVLPSGGHVSVLGRYTFVLVVFFRLYHAFDAATFRSVVCASCDGSLEWVSREGISVLGTGDLVAVFAVGVYV